MRLFISGCCASRHDCRQLHSSLPIFFLLLGLQPQRNSSARVSAQRVEMTLVPGTHLGSYEVLRPLGAGGMGEVYLARDKRLGRNIAIKVLPDEVTTDSVSVRRFER